MQAAYNVIQATALFQLLHGAKDVGGVIDARSSLKITAIQTGTGNPPVRLIASPQNFGTFRRRLGIIFCREEPSTSFPGERGRNMNIRRMIRVLVLLLALPVVSQGDEARTDNAKLQGTWKLVSLEAGGQPAPPEIVARLRLVFRNDTVTLTPGEPGFTNYTFKVDPTTRPPSFDMTPADGKHKGKTNKGIYSLNGDDLKICFNRDKARPREMNTKSGSVLYVLKREKP
jgi:uncharacterized protein (TIGR03067 family)